MSTPDNHTAQILESSGFDTALRFHMQARLFPPVHPIFADAFKSAIDSVNSGDARDVIELPNGREMTAGEIIRSANLYCFLDNAGEY